MCAGFESIDGGAIEIDGEPVRGADPRRVFVFQEFDQLLPWKTVLGNILLGLQFRGFGMSEKSFPARATLKNLDPRLRPGMSATTSESSAKERRSPRGHRRPELVHFVRCNTEREKEKKRKREKGNAAKKSSSWRFTFYGSVLKTLGSLVVKKRHLTHCFFN